MADKKFNLTKEELQNLYINKNCTAKEIGKLIGVDKAIILKNLRRFQFQ